MLHDFNAAKVLMRILSSWIYPKCISSVHSPVRPGTIYRCIFRVNGFLLSLPRPVDRYIATMCISIKATLQFPRAPTKEPQSQYPKHTLPRTQHRQTRQPIPTTVKQSHPQRHHTKHDKASTKHPPNPAGCRPRPFRSQIP